MAASMRTLLGAFLLLADIAFCKEVSALPDAKTSARSLLEAAACNDRNWQCYGWSKLGYCATNAGYMNKNCRKSCNKCGGGGRPRCKGLNQPCWVNAQCCSARCHPNTYHCRPVGR
ncbi:Peptidyl serine alpha-galactosyltransferase (CrSGT1) [Durusdinium trenchii]|uniref:Peptidyl serine alpha-galactosyltransferase (CrSGT1) n=1 Tax=Durusdinium trenchii TaxID=1381693 RepID=A0ABP0S3Y2_9DINO